MWDAAARKTRGNAPLTTLSTHTGFINIFDLHAANKKRQK